MRFNTKKNNNVRFEDLNIHNHWYHSSYHHVRCNTRDNICLIYIYIYTLYLHPIYVMGISGDILKCIGVISLSHQLPSNIILHQVRLGNPLNMISIDGIKK